MLLVRWSLPVLSALMLLCAEAMFVRLYPPSVLQKGTIAPYTIRADSTTVFDLHETRAAELREARQAYIPIYDKDNELFYTARSKILGAALERPLESWGWHDLQGPSDDGGSPVDAGAAQPDLDGGSTFEGRAAPSSAREAEGQGSIVVDGGLTDGGLASGPAPTVGEGGPWADMRYERQRELESLVLGAFRLLEPFYKRGVIADNEFPREKRTVRLFAGGRYTPRRVSQLDRFSELRPALERGSRQFFFKSDPRVNAEVIDFVLQRLPANVTYAQENERFIADISQVTGLKIVLIPRGAILVGQGDTVDTRAHYALRAGALAARETSWTERQMGRFGLVAALLLMLGLASQALAPGAFSRLRSLLFVHGSIIVLFVVTRYVLVRWPVQAALVPQAAAVLVAAVVLGRASAVLVAIAISTSLAFALHFDLTGVIVGCAGGMVAALVVRPRRRFAVLAAGVLVGLAQALALEACRAAAGQPQQSRELWAAGQAFVGGLLAGPVALVGLPFVQRWMGQASRGGLSVLADFDHLLYRKLRERTPEVFAHTVRVVNLADAAAKAAGADRLLTRVGALLHDIGKLQLSAEERAVSSETHIATGLELARRWHLPVEVVEFIEQHHGTLLPAHDESQSEIGVDQAHHPTARIAKLPRQLEVAIVMLANLVEHVSRAEPERSPADLVEQTLIELVRRRQLVRCAVTQEELDQIRTALVAYLQTHRDS